MIVEMVASWIRDHRQIRILPLRLRVSRAGAVVAMLAAPWAVLIILGTVGLYSAIGVSIPAIPPAVRTAVVVIALAPAAVALVAGLGRGYRVGPVPGVRWMFEPPPTLLMDGNQLRLSVGAKEQWNVRWAQIERLEGMGQPEQLAVFRANDPDAVVVPRELLNGRVAGSGVIVDVVGLIATMAPTTALLKTGGGTYIGR
jgi:hypothetical protein